MTGHPFKRDMDLIRSLLLEIEDGRRAFVVVSEEIAAAIGADEESALSADEAHKLEYHLTLLDEAGFVTFDRTGSHWLVNHLTWQGQEFLAPIRDPEVWRRTKQGASKAGSAGLAFMWELAKAYGKQVASERLKLPLP